MNTAYSYGGPPLVIKTFKELTGPARQRLGRDQLRRLLARGQHPRRRLPPRSTTSTSSRPAPTTSPSTSSPATSWCAASRRSTTCATATTRRVTSRACSVSSCSSRSCSASPAAGAATGQGARAHQGHHRRDQVETELPEEARAARRARVRGRHLQGLPGAPRRRHADDRRHLLRHRHRGQIAAAVDQFTNPAQAPVQGKAQHRIGKKMYTVNVYNGSGIDGLATTAAIAARGTGLRRRGGRRRLRVPGHGHGRVRAGEPGERRPRPSPRCSRPPTCASSRAPGVQRRHHGHRRVVVRRRPRHPRGGRPGAADAGEEPELRLGDVEGVRTPDAASSRCPRHGRAASPTTSSATTASNDEGKGSRPSVAVVRTPQCGYWSIQAMRWTDPPAIENPSATQRIVGPQVPAVLPGRRPAHGRLEGARHPVLGAQHARQPALQRPHAGPRDVVQAREVKLLRAVVRRLDPWAALLLGGLLALGVVILLATPGPWQRVVGRSRRCGWRRRPPTTWPCS